MLRNISSLYFIKNIFEYLDIKIKLKICKYNKALQNLINIKLLHFKILSGKYIKYETNGKVKEYDILTDELIFEGEYLRGKRNGKGKEYNYNYLIFEGEYLNGKKWDGKLYRGINNPICEIKKGEGVIKKYNSLDKLIFEGEYKNGEINGQGREYNDDGKLLFEGEYLNNKKWNGNFYIENKISSELINGNGFVKENSFEGYYLNGEKNGIGKEYIGYFKDIIYSGDFINGKRNGKGKEYYIHNNKEKLLFIGEYFNNYRLRGKEYVYNKVEFEGDFLLDKKWEGKGYDENGNISYELKNGNGKIKEYKYIPENYFYLVYEGEYLNGKRHEKGKEYYDIGNLFFEGEYKNGKRNGKGKEYYLNDLLKIEGEYLNNEKWNVKEYEYCYNSLKYERIYLNGKRLKIEKEYDLFGNLIFEGEYLNGKRWNGKMKEYDKNEQLVFDGEYFEGKRWNGKIRKIDKEGKLIFEGEYLNGQIKS